MVIGWPAQQLALASATLDIAEYWMTCRPLGAPDVTSDVRAFIATSRQGARSSQRIRQIVTASMFTSLVVIIFGLVGWVNQAYIADQWRFLTLTWPFERTNVRPYVLSTAKEQVLKPGDSFRECAVKQLDADYCPDMVVVPAGSFTMGEVDSKAPGYEFEIPQHTVTFAKTFAVSKISVDLCRMGCLRRGRRLQRIQALR